MNVGTGNNTGTNVKIPYAPGETEASWPDPQRTIPRLVDGWPTACIDEVFLRTTRSFSSQEPFFQGERGIKWLQAVLLGNMQVCQYPDIKCAAPLNLRNTDLPVVVAGATDRDN